MKKFEAKKINDMELDCVSGGTVDEMWDIANKMLEREPGFFAKFGRVASTVGYYGQNYTGVGKISSIANGALATVCEKYLANMGIHADINVGKLGFGLWERANRYEVGGKRISHSEVLLRMSK